MSVGNNRAGPHEASDWCALRPILRPQPHPDFEPVVVWSHPSTARRSMLWIRDALCDLALQNWMRFAAMVASTASELFLLCVCWRGMR